MESDRMTPGGPMTHTSAATPLSAEQRYPEIPDGQMCDSCGSLRYHGAFCEKAPPVVRAGMRHHLDLLDIRLRELGVLGDSDLRRYRDELGKAVGLVCGYYDSALLAARADADALRDAAKLVAQIGSQIINNADVYSNTDFLVRRNYVDALGAALNGLAAALAAAPERDTR